MKAQDCCQVVPYSQEQHFTEKLKSNFDAEKSIQLYKTQFEMWKWTTNIQIHNPIFKENPKQNFINHYFL